MAVKSPSLRKAKKPEASAPAQTLTASGRESLPRLKLEEKARLAPFAGWPQSRPAIFRLAAIHDELVRAQGFANLSQRPVNAGTLSRLLEVSPKTVWRDVSFMRDLLGAPVVYDPAAHSFRYLESVTSSFLDYVNHLRRCFQQKEAA